MKIIGVHCPYCGGKVKFDIDLGKKYCFCSHCGQQIILDDEVIKTEHTEIKVDQARIHEADKAAQVELEKLRLYEKEIDAYYRRKKMRLKLGIAWLVVFIIYIIFAYIYSQYTSDDFFDIKSFTIGEFWVIFGAIAILVPAHDDEGPKMEK